jgi:hypothetical protein
MVLRYHYTWHRPTAPVLLLNRTIPVSVDYGKVVYVSPADKTTLDIAYGAFGLSCLLVIVVVFLRRRAS